MFLFEPFILGILPIAIYEGSVLVKFLIHLRGLYRAETKQGIGSKQHSDSDIEAGSQLSVGSNPLVHQSGGALEGGRTPKKRFGLQGKPIEKNTNISICIFEHQLLFVSSSQKQVGQLIMAIYDSFYPLN